ncbi:MAG: type 1 glutamine amidotransferase [Gammaproteobacteria bacterium]
MKRILVFQHVPFEILGTFHPLLKKERVRMRYVNFGHHPDAQPSLSGYHGLIILGGPMNVNEVDCYPYLAREVELIKQAIADDMPILGICLGAQLIAKALGAKVYAGDAQEVGWYDVSLTAAGKNDLLFASLGNTEKIFQMHRDRYDLPEGAVNLATSGTCQQQAFRYGDKVYGFQFHLEADQALIERWLRILEQMRKSHNLDEAIDLDKIRKETYQYIDHMHALSNNVFSNFISLFGLADRVTSPALPSR